MGFLASHLENSLQGKTLFSLQGSLVIKLSLEVVLGAVKGREFDVVFPPPIKPRKKFFGLSVHVLAL